MKDMSPSHILIIGAGLGGPAMALALARNGIHSTLYERRASCQDIGGILSLAPNAVRVLDKIVGVEHEVRQLGSSFKGFNLYLDTGNKEAAHMGEMGNFQRTGYDGISIKRPVLHNKLVDLCKANEMVGLEYNKRLKEIKEDEKGVTAIFEDGTQARGDILLGFDGIHSVTRNHVLGSRAADFKPVYTGNVTIGASVPTPANVNHLPGFFLSQAGSLLAFHDSADNKSVQWATFIQTKERSRGEWDEYRDSGEAQAELKREWGHITAEPMRTLVQDLLQKPTKDILIWAPYAVPGDLPTWHTDRVCLMGDSAHAISPSGGQGTAQALEDVALMTRLLTSSQALSVGYPRLFEHFEKSRTGRLDEIRKMTERTLNTRFSTPNPWWWMAKKFMYRTGFSMMHLARYIRSNPVEYDVTTERIDLAK